MWSWCSTGWDERAYWISSIRPSFSATSSSAEAPGSRSAVPGSARALRGGDRGLLPLLELPIQRVLVTHGEPVLENGRAALAAALRS